MNEDQRYAVGVTVGVLSVVTLLAILAVLLMQCAVAVASDGLWRDPADPSRVLYCQQLGGKCWWLEPIREGAPGEKRADYEPARIVDFPCEEIVDQRGLTLESTATTVEFDRVYAPGVEGVCIVGGHVTVSAAAGAPPPHTTGAWVEADPFLLQDRRVTGTATGIRVGKDSSFFVRSSRFEGITESCIDNTERRSGHVLDSLFDGCFRFYDSSGEPEGPPEENGLVVIERSLVRMGGEAGAAGPFRFGARHPRLALHGVTFLIEGSPVSGTPGLPDASLLQSCKDVTVVYTGNGELGGRWPEDCVTVTGDRSVWDRAVAQWEANHGADD